MLPSLFRACELQFCTSLAFPVSPAQLFPRHFPGINLEPENSHNEFSPHYFAVHFAALLAFLSLSVSGYIRNFLSFSCNIPFWRKLPTFAFALGPIIHTELAINLAEVTGGTGFRVSEWLAMSILRENETLGAQVTWSFAPVFVTNRAEKECLTRSLCIAHFASPTLAFLSFYLAEWFSIEF